MSNFNISELLNNQSKTGTAKPQYEYKKIHLDDLEPSPENEYGIRDIESLAASIEFVGLLQDLIVKQNPETGKYNIVAGERRYRACRLLVENGNEEYALVPCKIEVKTDNKLITELQLIAANSEARELNDYEKTYQARRYKEILLELKEQGYKFTGRMRELVAKQMKVSPAQVGKMESINDHLSDEGKEAFRKEEIGITEAYEISRLPEDKQTEVLEDLRETGKVDVKEVKQKRSLEEQGKTFNNGKCNIDGQDCEHGIIKAKHFLNRGNEEKTASNPRRIVYDCLREMSLDEMATLLSVSISNQDRHKILAWLEGEMPEDANDAEV